MDADTPDEVFTFSASGISTARGCLRKAAYRYVLNVDTPANKSAALGSAIHKEMEEWFLQKQVPTLAPAKRLLPLAPNPTHPGLCVERPFRILLPVGAARGFKDLLVLRPENRLMPDGDWSGDRPAVFDWKSTSNLAYAKSEVDLLKDPQAILYGVAARLAVAKRVSDVPEVDLQWSYTTTRGADTRAVRLRQTLAILEDGLSEVIDTATQMRSAFAEAATQGLLDEVEYDLRECERFGGCPHKAYCEAQQHYAMHGVALDLRKKGSTVESPNQETPPDLVGETVPMSAANSALLAKLRAAAKTPPRVVENPPALEIRAEGSVVNPPAPEVIATIKPTPEPELPKPDTSGLDFPLPVGAAPINSEIAAPNVTPEDPPAPAVVVAEVVTQSRTPRRTKRPAVVLPAVDPVEQNLEATLREEASRALQARQYAHAARVVAVLCGLPE